nr:immunoglobulin light chain junction region [Macaca mulatta]MOW04576.1 immunoglobulin light chain junction region [Macaca mulatta]MOW04684.1 immunoglobulin light chain junction region [Macaca mulatta]MOW04714.1 immunoglobulin light chain junction region [Macaca mulatta]MOW04734.1 immunoglobulin light chain junction region [Macaca mulatta]
DYYCGTWDHSLTAGLF